MLISGAVYPYAFLSSPVRDQEEAGHHTIISYLSRFHKLIPLHDISVSELLVWTADTTAQMIGEYDKASKGMNDYIEETIQAAESVELSGTRAPVAAQATLQSPASMDDTVVAAAVLVCD